MAFKEFDKETIYKVFNKYFNISGNGKEQIKVLCPFHKEDVPSMSLNLTRGIYNCFGCGEKGNIIDLISKLDKCSMKEAFEKVERPDNIMGDISMRIHKTLYSEERKADKIIPMFPDTFKKYENKEECPVYLLNRLKWETIDHFKLGYCEEFKERVIIPILMDKKIVGFMARDYIGKEPKYLFPTDWKKSKCVFYDNTLDLEKFKEEIIITEGVFDTMSMFEKGFINTIAIFGVLLSIEQLKWLCNVNSKRVVVCLDNDFEKVGNKASIQIAKKLRHYFKETYIMKLSSKDPAESPKEELVERYGNKIRI